LEYELGEERLESYPAASSRTPARMGPVYITAVGSVMNASKGQADGKAVTALLEARRDAG